MDEETKCKICGEIRSNINHNNTLNHKFHFFKWAYNSHRKRLINDRHGVTVEAEAQKINNFNFDFQHVKGKYVTKVTPEQLRLHNSTITFKCKIINIQSESVYLINLNLLHPSAYFKISLSHNFGEDENTFVKLNKGKYFPFEVIFSTDLLQNASYKIPLSCDIQTVDSKHRFTIVRTFLVVIDDADKTQKQNTKSPFTSQSWKDVRTLIPSTKEVITEDRYPIPKEYIQLIDYCWEPFDKMTPAQAAIFRDIRGRGLKLTKENYAWFWDMILWTEERAQSVMLMKYNMQNVIMTLDAEETLILEVPGLAEKRPSVIVGDFIKMKLSDSQTAYKGFISKVNEKTVEITHVNNGLLVHLRKNPRSSMDVAFILGRLALERMHNAVHKIVETGMVEKLFPTRVTALPQNTNEEELEFHNLRVEGNSEQRNAVYKIVHSVQNIPYIVFGPPGTGKTVTIVEAILQIKERTTKRILVCAPANSACDMLALKLKEHFHLRQNARTERASKPVKANVLKSSVPEELLEYSNIMDEGEFDRVMVEKLITYRIVVTTLTLIGRYSASSSRSFASYHPDCVFIDEAAQASEPETDIAISLVKVGSLVVLAGDPKQLGPMATKCAAQYGLEKSLLERLMEFPVYSRNPTTKQYNSDFITMLKLNFRSHPDILKIPNAQFYHNDLKPVSVEAQRDPIVNMAIFPRIKLIPETKKGRAVEFCSISAKEMKEGSSPSFFNLCESRKVVDYVEALLRLNVHEVHRVREDQIGVVTPYKRQVHKIKEGLKRRGYKGVEVGTTESFQGREKRVIIISTVRAQHSLLLHDRKYKLGFVKEDKRFNVAVTRAISKLIVIGSPLVLRTDGKWASYMEMCQGFGTYFGNYFAPDDSVFREEVLLKSRNFRDQDDQYKGSSK